MVRTVPVISQPPSVDGQTGSDIGEGGLELVCACGCACGSACVCCVSRAANGQISSSSRQGDVEVAEVLGEEWESAGASHSTSLLHAHQRVLLRCLRAREAARAGGGNSVKGESDITTIG